MWMRHQEQQKTYYEQKGSAPYIDPSSFVDSPVNWPSVIVQKMVENDAVQHNAHLTTLLDARQKSFHSPSQANQPAALVHIRDDRDLDRDGPHAVFVDDLQSSLSQSHRPSSCQTTSIVPHRPMTKSTHSQDVPESNHTRHNSALAMSNGFYCPNPSSPVPLREVRLRFLERKRRTHF